jgi:hypothetical protein
MVGGGGGDYTLVIGGAADVNKIALNVRAGIIPNVPRRTT